jgi:peptide/nickel transport system ATP-binding protein
MADTIGVMYFGKLVEVGPAEQICTAPAHPYTAGLIGAVPAVAAVPAVTAAARPAPEQRPAAGLPLATRPPSGCRFRTRCPRAQDICARAEPPLQPHPPGGQLVACHFPLGPGAPESADGQTSARGG